MKLKIAYDDANSLINKFEELGYWSGLIPFRNISSTDPTSSVYKTLESDVEYVY